VKFDEFWVKMRYDFRHHQTVGEIAVDVFLSLGQRYPVDPLKNLLQFEITLYVSEWFQQHNLEI
jgi:hypothetical protein